MAYDGRMSQIPFAFHNLHGPDKNVQHRHTTIDIFLDNVRGGIGGFNELSVSDRAYLKAAARRRGLLSYVQGFNGIVWNPKALRANSLTPFRIQPGGYIGADGVHTAKGGDDDRRVGPARWVIRGDFTVMGTGFTFEFDVTHLVAKAFTTQKFRQRLWRLSVDAIGNAVRRGDGILVGDMNNGRPIDIPGVADRFVNIGKTLGGAAYDQARLWGRITVSGISQFSTPSDHDGVRGTLNIPDGTPSPAPVAPKPVAPVKVPVKHVVRFDPRKWRSLGAPVKHPFAPRSRAWKRRHPTLWKRIVSFQTAWKRKHG